MSKGGRGRSRGGRDLKKKKKVDDGLVAIKMPMWFVRMLKREEQESIKNRQD